MATVKAQKKETGAAARYDAARAQQRCLNYRHRILDMSQQVSALHCAPAFSCLEMVDVIYNDLVRKTGKTLSDSFVMSKGHGCLAQYVILEDLGILTKDDLTKYCTPHGILGAHPDYGNPGIEASTGSLGHGLGMAVGMAYAEKISGRDRKVYAVLSDGELMEGSSWEAMAMATNLKVNNLVAFLDLNDFNSMDRVSEKHPAFYPVLDKVRAFGWEAAEVNGHDAGAIHAAATGRKGDRPMMVVGKTIKGKGVCFMEEVPIWHYRSPNKDEYAKAKSELREVRS